MVADDVGDGGLGDRLEEQVVAELRAGAIHDLDLEAQVLAIGFGRTQLVDGLERGGVMVRIPSVVEPAAASIPVAVMLEATRRRLRDLGWGRGLLACFGPVAQGLVHGLEPLARGREQATHQRDEDTAEMLGLGEPGTAARPRLELEGVLAIEQLQG